MTQPKQVSFAEYLDTVFASPIWLEATVNMLSVFLEDIETCRDEPEKGLPELAPSIVDQVEGVAGQAKRLERQFRDLAEKRGPEFKTTELGAVLWWAGMASHKAAATVQDSREQIERQDWMEVFIRVHSLLFDTISALTLLSTAEQMISRMESEQGRGERRN